MYFHTSFSTSRINYSYQMQYHTPYIIKSVSKYPFDIGLGMNVKQEAALPGPYDTLA